MPGTDWERERERLRAVYAAMSNRDLQKVADDADSLADAARAVLRAEMLRRGMEAPPETRAPDDADAPIPKPVIIRRYRDLPATVVEKSVLDSAGIEGFLADDIIIRLDWLISNAVGGVKLWVRGSEATEARDLLAAGVPETFDVEGVGEYRQPKCPDCGSLDVSLEELNRKIAHLGLLLIGIPIPARKRGWNCHACGHAWDSSPETPAE
jgi:hypothetical protein